MSRKRAPSLTPPALDLNKVHFEGIINGILVLGSWVRRKGAGVKYEPCLVLLHPMRPIAAGRTVPIIIPLSEAWRWALHGDVGDPAHCVASVCDWFVDGLLPGNPAVKADYMRVVDAINQRLPDLIAMPPRPKGDTAAIGEAFKLDAKTGRIIEEREIRVDV